MRFYKTLTGGLMIAGVLALTAGAANAQDWCGFHQKTNARVQCGYSSLQGCKHALAGKKDGDKGVTCVPDTAQG